MAPNSNMASTHHFFFTVLLVFLSLLAIVSADYGYGPNPMETERSDSEIKEKPIPIGVQGTIFCKSGSNYEPIQGGVVRVTCLAVDENGYETAPFSVLSYVSDAKGYFFATLYPSQISNELRVTECKAFLEESPLQRCKVPTDVNNGVRGALLSRFRLLNDKHMKLYTVGPFFFTNQEPVHNDSGY